MEVFDAVRTALAIRNYKETPVPPDVVRRIVDAGRLAGSAMNGQPWHFGHERPAMAFHCC